MIDLADRLLFQSPKITGKVEHVFVRSRISPEERKNPLGDKPGSSAADCEVLIGVYAVNKRHQSTTIQRWELAVEYHKRKAIGTAFVPPDNHLIWSRPKEAGIPIKNLMVSGSESMFEHLKGFDGWLAFEVQGVYKGELENSIFKVAAIDAKGKRHTLPAYDLSADSNSMRLPGLHR